MPKIPALISGAVGPGMNAAVIGGKSSLREAGRICETGISRIGGRAVGMKNGRVFHMPIDQAPAASKRFDRAPYQLVSAQ